ncbi:MAG: hypothetical protein Kow00122_00760 [Thermoleophilia bacterium]
MNRGGPRRRPERYPAPARARLLLPLLILAVFLAAVLVVSGCTIELGLDTTIGKDGSGTVGVRLAADKEIQDLMRQQGGARQDFFGDFAKRMPPGWKVEQGTDPNGTRWAAATATFADPAELEGILAQLRGGPSNALAAQKFDLSQDRGVFSTTTRFAAEWDMSKALSGLGERVPSDLNPQLLLSVLRVQNRLTLPGSLQDHNATAVEGRTLVWTPAPSGVTRMYARSVVYDWGTIAFAAALGVLVVFGVVAAFLVSRRRRSGGGPGPAALPAGMPRPGLPEESGAPPAGETGAEPSAGGEEAPTR